MYIQICHTDRRLYILKTTYAKKNRHQLTLKTSQVALKGSTAIPTIRSATASDTMNKLVTLRSLLEQKTAAITRQLPRITSCKRENNFILDNLR